MKLTINCYGNSYEVFCRITKYATNNALAIQLVMDTGEPFGNMTVNLEGIPNEDCAYLDTNNMPEVEEIVKKYHLGEPTGRYGQSGFCTYPEYKFNMKELYKYTMEE